LDEKLPPAIESLAVNQDPMPRTEFNRRVAALAVPAPEAPRREVALYLVEFLRLVDALRHGLMPDDPCTRQLAALVPAHLDLLLDGLPAMDGPSKSTVLNALELGAAETQKPLIIAALAPDPELAQVLFARGWVNDARTEIMQLAQSPQALPPDALRAIAWFQEPGTFPRLLEEFEANPTVGADTTLGTLPGLAPQLDTIVARAWHQQSLMFRQNGWELFGEDFRLALRHGQASAIQRAFQVLNDSQFNQSDYEFELAAGLRDGVQMAGLPPEERQKPAAVLAWLRLHRADDFIFNPALRQFVLRPELAGNAPPPPSNAERENRSQRLDSFHPSLPRGLYAHSPE
jgi:hypothetical protein